MSFNAVQALRDYHAALEARDFVLLETMFAGDARYESAGIGSLVGRDAIMQSLRSYFASHPDHQAWDESIVAVSALVARSVWRLEAGEIARSGVEIVTFSDAGCVTRVEVSDV